MLTTRGDDALTWMRTGVDAQGRIVARQAVIYLNTGAYAENSPLVCEKAANRSFGPYNIPNVRIDCYAVYTNTVPASSFRGFGCAQVTMAGESQVDEMAAKMGVDPLEFRLANVARKGEVFFPGHRALDGNLRQDLGHLASALEWGTSLPSNHGRAVGISASDAGAYPLTSAAVRIHGDGSVSIMTGSTELGQGSHTTLPQIAAEELGVSLDMVRVVASDTAITPYDRSTGASRTTTLMGRAILEACQEAIAQMHRMAAEVLEASEGEVIPEGDGVRYGKEHLSWSQILGRYFGLPDGEVIGRAYLRKAGDLADLPVFWEVGCTGVEISVDGETGVLKVERLATVGDIGLAINPALSEGQDLGAAMMGLGIGLLEELTFDGPQLANGSLLEYRVPRFSDLPRDIRMSLVQNRDGVGPYGAKGTGEATLNAMPANIANALFHAAGVRIRRAPLTPERVWRALNEAGENRS